MGGRFHRGTLLWGDGWRNLLASVGDLDALVPILALLDGTDGRCLIAAELASETDIEDLRQQVLQNSPEAVRSLARYWRHRQQASKAATRGADQGGRNAACPCGSGKKHKKCCLVANRLL